MINDLLQEVGLHGIDDIEEVLAAQALADSEVIGEVLGDVFISGELRPQRLHGELIVVRHLDEDHLRLPQELLLLRQDLLQEVLIDGAGGRQVELDYNGVKKEMHEYLRCWSKYLR